MILGPNIIGDVWAKVLVWISFLLILPKFTGTKGNKSYELTVQTKHPAGRHIQHKSLNSAQAKGGKKTLILSSSDPCVCLKRSRLMVSQGPPLNCEELKNRLELRAGPQGRSWRCLTRNTCHLGGKYPLRYTRRTSSWAEWAQRNSAATQVWMAASFKHQHQPSFKSALAVLLSRVETHGINKGLRGILQRTWSCTPEGVARSL